MKTTIAITAMILSLTTLGARGEGHQPMRVDFDRLIDDVNRDGNNLHDEIARDIQDVGSSKQWDKNDDVAFKVKSQHKIVEAEMPDSE